MGSVTPADGQAGWPIGPGLRSTPRDRSQDTCSGQIHLQLAKLMKILYSTIAFVFLWLREGCSYLGITADQVEICIRTVLKTKGEKPKGKLLKVVSTVLKAKGRKKWVWRRREMGLRCVATLVSALSPLFRQCMCAAAVTETNNFHSTFLAGPSSDWPC